MQALLGELVVLDGLLIDIVLSFLCGVTQRNFDIVNSSEIFVLVLDLVVLCAFKADIDFGIYLLLLDVVGTEVEVLIPRIVDIVIA